MSSRRHGLLEAPDDRPLLLPLRSPPPQSEPAGPRAAPSQLFSASNNSSREEFYARFQAIGRQRQIAQHHRLDNSQAVVEEVNEGNMLSSPDKRTLRRLRSRTMPEMMSPSSPKALQMELGKSMDDNDMELALNESIKNVLSLSQDGDTDIAATSRQRRQNIVENEVLSPIPARRADKTMPIIGREVEGVISPRAKYIQACMREGLNPRASLMLKRQSSKLLNLQHQVFYSI